MECIFINPNSTPCLPPLTLYRAKQDEKIIFANIEDYEHRLQRALSVIGRMRCPLSQADGELYDEMNEAINEYIEENELSDEIDFDVEDIIFQNYE